MIVVYTSPGCASCRKVKAWLKERNLNYLEKNIFKTILNPIEIKHLLSRCENGTEDLISKRSKAYSKLTVDIDDLSMNELVDLIQKNPSILKRPIMINEKSFVVGYDDDEITALVPAQLRLVAERACNPNCVHYNICGRVREERCVMSA